MILILNLIILSIIFLYSYFLFNGETLEGILKQRMIPLLFFMSAFITLPIINVTNHIFKKIQIIYFLIDLKFLK